MTTSTDERTAPTTGEPLEHARPANASSGAALWRHIGLLLPLLILGGFLRFNQLGAKGLWGDEIWTAQWSQPSLPQVLAGQTKPPDILPLMYALVHISTRLGANEFWVRLPAALFGVIGLALFYGLAHRTLGRRTALVGTALLALSPIHIWYSQDARYYTLITALGIASVCFFYTFITADRVRPASWLGFVLITTAALYTHIFAGWIILAEGAFAVWFLVSQALRGGDEGHRQRREVRAKAFWLVIALLCLALLALPVLLGLVEALQRGTSPGGEGMARLRLTPALPYFFTTAFFAEMVQYFSGGRTATLLMLPFLVVGLAATWRRKRNVAVLLICLMAAPFLTSLFIEFLHAIDFRYFLYLLPVYLLLVAEGFVVAAASLERAVTAWIQRRNPTVSGQARQQPVMTLALLALVLLALLATVRPLQMAYAQAKINDWRAIAGYLASNVPPEDVVLTERWGAEALRYYLPPASNITILTLNPDRWQRERFLGERTWLVGLEDEYERQAIASLQMIDDVVWQDARWIYERSLQDNIYYPVTEFPAHIYLDAGATASPFVDFMDIDDADWTQETYRALAPGRTATVRLTLEAAATRVLNVRHLDWPGQDFDVCVDGQQIGSVKGGSLGGWQTWQGTLPQSAGDSVQVSINALGSEHVGLDWIRLAYAVPPVAKGVDHDAPVDLTIDNQGAVDFDDIQNADWTTETYRHLALGDEISVLLGVSDQAARLLTIRYYDMIGKDLDVRANGQLIDTITGGNRGGGWIEELLFVPGGLGEEVLIQIQAIGSEASGVSGLVVQRVE